MKPIISAKNLNFTYNRGKDNEYQALINISVDIYEEEFVIFFGPSGCGKSTLLNVMASLELPDSGEIFVFGKNLITMNPKEVSIYHRKQVGMVYQSYNLITSLTVLENVALPQLFVDVSKRRRERWAKQLLDRFGILQQAKKIPTELSGGQQQRIGIARAIVNNPRIVLADEPVGNLDSMSAKNVLKILGDLNEKEKKTIVLVTHNPEYLEYGDRIIYMKDGIITREVINHNKHKDKKIKKQEIVPKSTITEISDIMRAYRNLSPEQINILIMPYKAKAFANHFISNKSMEETRVLEDIIQKRLLGLLSSDDFLSILTKNFEKGGVGFDKRTAKKIFNRINRMIKIAYFVYKKRRQKKDENGQHIKVSDDEKAEKVMWYLLKTCYNEYYHNLSENQIDLLQQSIKERLTSVIQKKVFYKRLDLPIENGGVGLNSKTAKNITRELELILILGFGVVQVQRAKEK